MANYNMINKIIKNHRKVYKLLKVNYNMINKLNKYQIETFK